MIPPEENCELSTDYLGWVLMERGIDPASIVEVAYDLSRRVEIVRTNVGVYHRVRDMERRAVDPPWRSVERALGIPLY